jgi:hypothetical protein
MFVHVRCLSVYFYEYLKWPITCFIFLPPCCYKVLSAEIAATCCVFLKVFTIESYLIVIKYVLSTQLFELYWSYSYLRNSHVVSHFMKKKRKLNVGYQS